MTATGDAAHDLPDPSGQEGDYSYDLAHEAVPAATREGRASVRPHPGPAPAAGADTDGDYSYDLAHEVPPSRPR